MSLLTAEMPLIGSGLALIRIADEARADPELLHDTPHGAPVRRLDEVKATKDLMLSYAPGCGG